MDTFEFVFTLFGLVLGLALAEVLQGLVRCIRDRQGAPVGWLLPMLGVVVAVDLISFWFGAWQGRAAFQPAFPVLVALGFLSGLYFVTASLVFPAANGERWTNDAWFDHRRRLVGFGVMAANLLFGLGETVALGEGNLSNWQLWVYLSGALLVALAPGRRLAAVGLVVMLLMHCEFLVREIVSPTEPPAAARSPA